MTYTLTGNITTSDDGIIAERDNIIIAYDNAGNNATLYETDLHNSYQVVPEYPSLTFTFLPIVITLLTFVVCKKKTHAEQNAFSLEACLKPLSKPV